MRLDEAFAGGQADAVAVRFRGESFAEEALQVFRGDTAAAVAYRQSDVAARFEDGIFAQAEIKVVDVAVDAVGETTVEPRPLATEDLA